MRRIGAALLATGFVLLIPILLPIGLTLAGLHRHRVRSAARRFACSGCGRVLGREAVRLADIEWDRRCAESRARYPDLRPRLVRDLHAICPTCGRRYRFLEVNRAFVEVPP